MRLAAEAWFHGAGRIVNFIGRVKGSTSHEDKGTKVPLLNKTPNMEDRGQICESLFTGVAAVDTLAPLGRGQSMLLAGLQGAGKMDVMLEIILGQRKSGVHCVLALIGKRARPDPAFAPSHALPSLSLGCPLHPRASLPEGIEVPSATPCQPPGWKQLTAPATRQTDSGREGSSSLARSPEPAALP